MHLGTDRLILQDVLPQTRKTHCPDHPQAPRLPQRLQVHLGILGDRQGCFLLRGLALQEVLVNQAIATLEDESRKEKLQLRYQDGWTLEYVAALLAKWESSTVSIDQQGRFQQGPRRQGQVHAVRSTRGSRNNSNRNGRQSDSGNSNSLSLIHI